MMTDAKDEKKYISKQLMNRNDWKILRVTENTRIVKDVIIILSLV